MCFLGPFFFLIYGLTNWFTAQRADVPSFYFWWETHLPFVPQLMLPYMSIDLFFAGSVFLCRNRAELHRHVQRIVLAILISATGFLLFPLKFAFDRPPVDGFNGWLLELLTGFDKPYNQAPSLHVSLLLFLWVIYSRHLREPWRYLLHLWFILIALSIVLVYQHHVIDVITGFAVGVLCLYFLPDGVFAPHGVRLTADPSRRVLGARYALGGLACALVAMGWQGAAWLLFWPAVALLVVAAGYLALGPAVFQKHGGRHSLAARWLLAPYLVGAWISYRLYTRGQRPFSRVAADVFIGRMPRCREMLRSPWRAVVDLTAEFSSCAAARGMPYANIPLLDLVAPDAATLRVSADEIERARGSGPVLVHCALGVSRSAAAVAGWMVRYGHAASIEEALNRLSQEWRTIVLSQRHRAALAEAVR